MPKTPSAKKRSPNSFRKAESDDSDAEENQTQGFASRSQWRWCFADQKRRKERGLQPRVNCHERAKLGRPYAELPEKVPPRKKKSSTKKTTKKTLKKTQRSKKKSNQKSYKKPTKKLTRKSSTNVSKKRSA